MKNNFFKIALLAFLSLSVASCDNSSNSDSSMTDVSVEDSMSNSPIDSSSEEEILEDVELTNENYTWAFKENSAYSNDLNFSVESNDEWSDLKVLIDDKPLTKKSYPDGSAKISFETDDEYPSHSDTLEHACNEMTFNGQVIGNLPSDDTKTIDIEFTDLMDGYNVWSITIGKFYVYDAKWDMNLAHGGLNGGGDDYKIRNVVMTTSTGKEIWPSKMVIYKPVDKTSAKYVTYEIQQEKDLYYWVGDGWSGNLTYDKHPDGGRYDAPFKIDYYFDWSVPLAINSYEISTTDYEDGDHVITLTDYDEPVLRNRIYFDNSAPEAHINLKDNDIVNQNYKVDCKLKDSVTPIVKKEVLLDGKPVYKFEDDNNDYSFSLKDVLPGQHNISIYAKDNASNEYYDSVDFFVRENSEVIDVKVNNNKISLEQGYEDLLTTKVYGADKLNYQKVSNNDNNKPVDIFTIDVTDTSKDLYVSYSGESFEGERLDIQALNPQTEKYERILLAYANDNINFVVDPAKYVSAGKVTIKVEPLLVSNGSNRLLWISDTQYLPKVNFTDLNPMYTKLMKYVSDEYLANKAAYMVHTGDIIDNNPSYKEDAIAEWEIATKAYEVLDNNNVPYGIVAGNHDVGTALSSIDYSYYSNYFGNFRFNKTDHFGGSLYDNACHYDLITIGQYDFVVVYIGFGIEYQTQTIKWANEVLQRYSHRNAIVATHGYLNPDGTMDDTVQGQSVYDEIVSKNENVKMVFCGHNDGTATVKKQVNDNRYVYELLNCYQFIQTKSYAISHNINGMTCNGEGFMKELVITENNVKITTFSPVINSYHQPFGKDNVEFEIQLTPAERRLTSNSFEVYQASNELASSSDLEFNYEFATGNHYIVYSSNSTDGYGFILI